MPENTARKFVEALRKLEKDHDLETIAGLFSETCKIGNVVSSDVSGARDFWEMYRRNFGEVESTFKNKIFGEGHAALEWTTKGKTSGGDEFEYEGVSILEVEDGKIVRFFAYFDPAKLGRQMS